MIIRTVGGVEGALNNATPVVSECVFWWCVNTISAEHVNSDLIENITNSVQVPSTFSDDPWRDANSSWHQSLFTLDLEDDQAEGGFANFSLNNVTTDYLPGSGGTYMSFPAFPSDLSV